MKYFRNKNENTELRSFFIISSINISGASKREVLTRGPIFLELREEEHFSSGGLKIFLGFRIREEENLSSGGI